MHRNLKSLEAIDQSHAKWTNGIVTNFKKKTQSSCDGNKELNTHEFLIR